MRIVVPPSCVAVLCLAACLLLRCALSSARQSDANSDRMLEAWDTRRLNARELQSLLRNASGAAGGAVECCPSHVEMVMPAGGIRNDGAYVEIFQDYEQSFYEVSCLDSVLDKPCRFVDRRLQAQSRCVQRYSYSYALVRDAPSEAPRHGHSRPHAHHNDTWRMDYIRVRSGCSCEVVPKATKKRGGVSKKQKKRLAAEAAAAAEGERPALS